MEEMVAPFLPFFDIYPYLCRQNRMSNPSKLIDNEKNDVTLRPLRHADSRNGRLTYGTAYFQGSQPSNCLSHGTVMIWYNGELKQTGLNGGVEIWEGTGDICVVYPKNYNDSKMRFMSKGGSVQIQTQK